MAAKMSNKFVTLCTLAVGAIYATGYGVTEASQTASVGSTVSAATAGQSTMAPTAGSSSQGSNASSTPLASTGTEASGKSAQAAPSGTSAPASSHTSPTKTSSPKPVSKPSNNHKYLDGTYQGSGSNNIGTVYVSVTIKSGEIANVHITECDTHYPEGYIDPSLPQEVMATQSPYVTNVSGATKSTRDFENAVLECLSKAHNPDYTGRN